MNTRRALCGIVLRLVLALGAGEILSRHRQMTFGNDGGHLRCQDARQLNFRRGSGMIRRNTLQLLTVALIAGAWHPARAQSDRILGRRVDQYLRPLVAAGDFNGTVLIARGNRTVVQRAYGKADWDLDVPLSVRTGFRVASITKTFTAAGIAMLVEQGKVGYDDPLAKYIPTFPHGDRIQIRHLLLHRAGVPNPGTPGCGTATLDSLIAEIARKPLDFEPGTQSRYSNGGYALLARVVEVASGTSWAAFMEHQIFQPLRLNATTIDDPSRIIPNRARGFVPGAGPAGVEHADCEGAWDEIGSGAVVSDAPDLYRWGRTVRADSLFRRTTLEYPYGWGVRKYFDHPVIEQSGITNGYASYLAVYLDADLYVVLLSNLQTGNLVELGKAVAALALGRPAPTIAPSPASVSWRAGDRSRWLGRFYNERIATIQVTDHGDGVRLRWGHSPTTVFLAATGPFSAYDRQDSIALSLSADGAVITMRWAGGEAQEFRRLP